MRFFQEADEGEWQGLTADKVVKPPTDETVGKVKNNDEPVVSGNALLSQLGDKDFSFVKAIGGVQGALEALLPTLVFVILFPILETLFWPLLASIAVSIFFALLRLSKRSSLTQVIFGLIMSLLGAFFAWKTGKAENYFALGFWINGVYATVIALTILVKKPLIGWLAAIAVGKADKWKQANHRIFYQNSLLATWAWVGLLMLRLVVELPLYYADLLVPLGIARIVLGVPAFAVVIWLTWILLRRPLSILLAD